MDLNEITAETLEQVKKAQTSGISTGTGIQGVNLSGLVSLIPVDVPFRAMLPRVSASEGAQFAQWRALLNVNNQQPNPAVGFDYAGGLAVIDEQNIQAAFQPIAMGYTVTQDAVDLAKSYADVHALATLNTLNQLMIGEDKLLLGGQNFALAVPGAPTVTPAATGGSIGATLTVDVKVAARTMANFFYGGSTPASAQGSGVTSAGTTNSAVAFTPSVKGAVAYDWFVDGFYYTTTTTNTVTITSIPTANAAVPNLPDLSQVPITAVPAVDSSAVANEFNGLLATLAGDYASNGTIVTAGTGDAPSGAVFQSADGGSLTLAGSAISQIDNLFLAIYGNVRLSPSALMMNAVQANELGDLVLGSPGAVTYLGPTDDSGRANATAGGFVGKYINKAAGGKIVDIEVHPHIPAGTIIARTDTVPFPGSNIGRTLEVETLRDYADFTYGSNRNAGVSGGGPRVDGEVRCVQTLKNFAPVAMGVLSNVA